MNRALWTLALILAGCAGDAKDTDTGGDDTAGEADPTFTRVKEEVLLRTCATAGCHAQGSINGMELVDGAEYEALVNAASIGNSGQTLVIPGDADGSYVVRKLEGAFDIVGFPMPPPSGGLPDTEITLMREWIDAGALDN